MEEQTSFTEKEDKFSWHDYNASQTSEKALFVNLLHELCSIIEEPRHTKGRKPHKIKDVIYSSCMRTYMNTSSRRVQSDLKIAKELGYIDKIVSFNSLLDNLERPELKSFLKELIEISSLPLKQIESDFAIDATGFGTSRYTTYFDVRYGKNKNRKYRMFRKCHAVCGGATNIIISAEITEGHVNEQTKFEELAMDTKRNFNIRNFCADKGYLAGENFALIQKLGGQAFIPFKSNTSANSSSQSEYRSYFKSAFNFFKNHMEEYLSKYHQRSNIESCFSMIKRKFGTNVKCKKEISQDNEILSKILVHNLCVLIQEIFLNKIDINFHYCAEHYVAR